MILTPKEIALRLAASLFVGALIGVERQWRHKRAGLRTNALVSLGAGLFCLIATLSTHDTSDLHIAAQIASGIGFLGAGVIIRDGLNVRGLDTAATLWCSAAAGALAGSGFYWTAVAGGAIVTLSNLILHALVGSSEKGIGAGGAGSVYYEVHLTCSVARAAALRDGLVAAIRKGELLLESARLNPLPDGRQAEVVVGCCSAERLDAFIEKQAAWLTTQADVTSVHWTFRDATVPNPAPGLLSGELPNRAQ